MQKIFRSRGIRIISNRGKNLIVEKCYYEPDEHCKINNNYLTDLQAKGILSLFEYAVVDEKIDTYNYHVSLTNEKYTDLYRELPIEVMKVFRKIKDCFGDCMKNYTIGYRLDKSTVTQQSFYFYPTIRKENRYKIKGITQREVILNGCEKISEFIVGENAEYQKKIVDFANLLYKFKGISVHVSNDNIAYKIYGRIEYDKLKPYLLEKFNYDIDQNFQYGRCVLVALRIAYNKIQGINIYFLR